MASADIPTSCASDNATPLQRFVSYPFASDVAYQQGLAGLSSGGVLDGKSEKEKSEFLLRSEVFYFNRITGLSVDIDEARTARRAGDGTLPSDGHSLNQEPSALTFAQLKELIELGKTDEIPNNKIIPNVLSTDPPSESKTAVKKKPWEVQGIQAA